MKWPTGKYNGRRIEGFKVSLALHVLHWFWKPVFGYNFGQPYFIWLCITLRGEPNYE